MTEAAGTSRRDFLKGAAVVGGLAALTAGGSLSAPEESYAAAKKPAKNAQATSLRDSYKNSPLVKKSAKWEKVYAFAKGDSAMIEGTNFDKNGNLWFIDIGMGRVMKLDMKTKKLTKYTDTPGKYTPNGARFIDDDTLLIADRNRGLCTYTISTNEYKELEMEYDLDNARWGRPVEGEKKGFDILNDLVLDGEGCAYVTDPGLSDYVSPVGRVWRVDYSGYKEGKAKAQVWARGIKYANGIAISPDGNFLYVAEFNTNSIINIPTYKYVQGKVLDTPYVVARFEGGHGPDGVTTDSKGNIYCAHLHAKEVVVVDPNGFPRQNIQLPNAANTDPSNLCIHGGYLYVCEFADGVIWRVKINAKPNPLEA